MNKRSIICLNLQAGYSIPAGERWQRWRVGQHRIRSAAHRNGINIRRRENSAFSIAVALNADGSFSRLCWLVVAEHHGFVPQILVGDAAAQLEHSCATDSRACCIHVVSYRQVAFVVALGGGLVRGHSRGSRGGLVGDGGNCGAAGHGHNASIVPSAARGTDTHRFQRRS